MLQIGNHHPPTFVLIKDHCTTPSIRVYVSNIDLVTTYARLRLAPNPSLAIISFTFHSAWVEQVANFQLSLASAPHCLCPRVQSLSVSRSRQPDCHPRGDACPAPSPRSKRLHLREVRGHFSVTPSKSLLCCCQTTRS